MDTDPSSILMQILLILVLILMNAFFAASEIAIVSLNKSKISLLAENGDKKAKILLKLIEEPSRFLATIQVGITLGGFFASASAATNLSQPLAALLSKFNIPGSGEIALIAVTIILSYITLVLGELYPKRLALQNAEGIAKFAVKPILLISKVAAPFVKILTLSTNLLVRISGINSDNLDEKVSKEEIRMMINAGEENGVFNEIEKEMINGIFEFDNTLAKEIMTPRVNVFMLDIKTDPSAILVRVLEEQYSRVPIYEYDIDNIIGVLYMKDLFIESNRGELTKDTIRNILRPAHFVPETKNIDELFRELQRTKNHMALLIDEYGAFNGVVTIEDLIEEVMGNIFDEYDENNDNIIKLDDTNYLVDGFTDIDDINEALNLNLPSEIFDTIGGFLIDLLGYIPKSNEKSIIEYNNLNFTVEKVEKKRISKIKISIN
ncbi:hemolysin family protein [Desnuesiella massiliensis]|uniref:hemolysin family protein n=1 Tax=Desnuesiella massiliensis TaxID=1650662 RepID=UPI0006E1BCD0|nr:hemolysin family protein [Desnuesiella massiliensis]